MVSVGHIVASKKKIEIDIPQDYVNKEIEIFIMPVEKNEKKKSKQDSILALKGILGEKIFKPGMKESAWEAAVEEKFLSH